ncbi:MAG: GEVED domain-containing protein [Planctomycetota bacterium]
MISTDDSVTPSDDEVFYPDEISYDPATDSAVLTFGSDIDQLVGGSGTFRLRIGSNTEVNSAANPPAFTELPLGGFDPDGFSSGALDVTGAFNGNNLDLIISQELVNVQNQLLLDFPGANEEIGHRDIFNQNHHFERGADADQEIQQAFYNFALDRPFATQGGLDFFTAITPDQIQRVREIYEFYGQVLGIDFIESESLGMTVVVGDLAGVDPTEQSAPGGTLGLAGGGLTGTAIMDGAENWDNTLGRNFFDTAIHEIGHLLGLGHNYELPFGTVMNGSDTGGVYPGDHDVVHGQHLFRPDNKDVDLFKIDVPVRGEITLESFAERLADSSNANTHLTLIRETPSGLEVVASNDDYFSSDSFIRTELEAGTYLVAITASGNEDFNPVIDNTGSGGLSQGDYELRLNFVPQVQSAIVDINGVAIDGDGDGIAGGDFNYWFRAAEPADTSTGAKTVYVNKDFAGASTGESTAPFSSIPDAIAAVSPGDIIRIAPTMGADGDMSTPLDNPAYEIGRGGIGGGVLADGVSLNVPQGVALMVDAGAIFKMGASRIVVGSLDAGRDNSFSSLQILGTPETQVIFTSYDDQSLGIDTNTLETTPLAGQWGGIEFRNDVDRAQGRGDYERQGIFLNYVGYADMRFGGGQVLATLPSPTISPIHMAEARPTVLNNTITNSADSAMSADPDSFEETLFTENRYQLGTRFRSDYERIGPDIRGSVLADNSINGLFVRVETLAGNEIDQLDVPGRFDDTSITHVLGENLIIRGTPGGSFLETSQPDVSLVTFADTAGDLNPGDTVRYVVTFVDRFGAEGRASLLTAPATVGPSGGVLLDQLPAATGDFVGRRLYRIDGGNTTFVAELDRDAADFADEGQDLGGDLSPTGASLNRARPDARLAIDPGILIKSAGTRIEVGIAAQLLAEGSEDKPIIFTSRADDRYGAADSFDTNNDLDGSTAAPGDWSGIVVRHGSEISMDHSLVTFAGGESAVQGGFSAFNALEVHQSDARIANSTFEFNADGRGGNLGTGDRTGFGTHDSSVIFIRGSQPVLIQNVIQDNQGGNSAAISIDVNSMKAVSVQDLGRQTGTSDALPGEIGNLGPLVRENTLVDNGINGLRVRGGILSTEVVWDDADIVHVLQDDVVIPNFHTFGSMRLQSRGGESLVVKADAGSSIIAGRVPNYDEDGDFRNSENGDLLDITDRIGGSLQVIGAPGFPVILTSLADDTVGAGFDPNGLAQTDTNGDAGGSIAAPGNWDGIVLTQLSNDRNVNSIVEIEPDLIQDVGINDDPISAQPLGALADDLRAGDENLRLGFTVQGAIASTSDLDVYSFVGTAGTMVWVDIDRTAASLDSVVEILDFDGNILAQSDNSLTESANDSVLFTSPTLVPGSVNPMEQGIFAPRNSWGGGNPGDPAQDFQSTNPADAGLRLELPGVDGTENNYYVRVRSSNVAPGDAQARLQNVALERDGLTTGSYRLQVRMQEMDEVGGSSIRYADIRFATTGIEVIGLPNHSPLLGTASAQVTPDGNQLDVHDNDAYDNVTYLGNIFASDRASFSVSGEIEKQNDFTRSQNVDWYEFEVSYEDLQSPGGGGFVTFDVDYADGFGRPNTSLWVYEYPDHPLDGVAGDREFQLVYVGRDSDIADDQVREGQNLGDVDDFSRGSAGVLDPFIGAAGLRGRYLVAVTSGSRYADELHQYTQASSTDANFATGFRLRPLSDTILDQDLLFGSIAEVPFNLADVTAFSLTNGGTNLEFTNAFTGVREAIVGDGFAAITDFALAPDGTLVGIATGTNDADSGTLFGMDPSGVTAPASIGNAGINTFYANQTADPPTLGTHNVGIQFEGLTFQNDGANLFGVGFRNLTDPDDGTTIEKLRVALDGTILGAEAYEGGNNIVYRLNPANGSAISNDGVDRTGNFQTEGAATQITEFFNITTAGDTRVTGLTAIGNRLYAVSAAGQFYNTMVVSEDGSRTISGEPETITTMITLMDDGDAIEFTGLGAGPANLEGGRFADILFGTTADGTIYAFNTAGVFQNIFPNGEFKIQSEARAASGVLDMEFSALDSNLWHNTGNGIQFGMDADNEDDFSESVRNSAINGTYNFPGGAHGAFETEPFDLRDYEASDRPAVYFDYFVETSQTNSIDLMEDSVRVFAAGDNGQWVRLATNNTLEGGQTIFDVEENGAARATRQVRAQAVMEQFAGQEHVRLRFEFNTGGGFRSSDSSVNGEELTAIDGWDFDVTDTASKQFSVSDEDLAEDFSASFEFDFGLVLDLPGGASIDAGDTIVVGGVPMIFGVNVPFTDTMTPQEIAQQLNNAINNALGGGTSVINPRQTNILNVRVNTLGSLVGGLPAETILDQPGVEPHPNAPLETRHSIEITQADNSRTVREAVRAELAEHLNIAGQETNVDVWPVHQDTIRLYKHHVVLGGAGGLQLFNSNRAGDTTGVSARALDVRDIRAQNNNFSGVTISSIILGMTERGESASGAPSIATNRITDDNDMFSDGGPLGDSSGVQIGQYQLEIRSATHENYDSNDRLAAGMNFDVNAAQIADGDQFTLTDGVDSVTFEFDVSQGGTDRAEGITAGNQEISIRPGDSAEDIAIAIRDSVNSSTVQSILGVSAHIQGNSQRVEFHGPAALSAGGDSETGIPGLTTVLSGQEILGEDFGDANRLRDQGVVIIESTFVRDSSQWGIDIDDPQRLQVGTGNVDQESGQGAHATFPGSTVAFPAPNSDRLVPGVIVANNVLDSNIVGGIRLSGIEFVASPDTTDILAARPIARVVNNSIFGANRGTGILVNHEASPIIVNNILASNSTGINYSDAASTITLGANFYFGNNQDVNDLNGTNNDRGAFDESGAVDPFIDAFNRNFYLVPGSRAIDSSLNSLAEIASLAALKNALNLPPSPVLAPDRDVAGQRRVDDPAVSSPIGLGSNVFRDRGAYDRADFIGLLAQLQQPIDNDSEGVDIDLGVTFVRLTEGPTEFFEVLLVDPFGGSGPDNATVVGDTLNSDNVVLTENGSRLIPGDDYVFGYNPGSRTIRFTPRSGFWRDDSVYEITLVNREGTRIDALAGISVAEGDQFSVSSGGNTFDFEWDSDGSVDTGRIAVEYDQSYDKAAMASVILKAISEQGVEAYLQAAGSVMLPSGTTSGASLGTQTIIEPIRDIAGNTLQANRSSTLTQFTLVMPEVKLDYGDGPNELSVTQANNGARHALLPIDVDSLALGTFADGDPDGTTGPSNEDDFETEIVSTTLTGPPEFGSVGQGFLEMPVPSPALDGNIIQIESGLVTLNFEFDSDGSTAAGSVVVDVTAATTANEVAVALAAAVNSKLTDGTITGVAASVFRSDLVDLGVAPDVNVDISGAPELTQRTVGNIEVRFSAGAYTDGQSLEIRDGEGVVTTFEINDTSAPGAFRRDIASLELIDIDLTAATAEDVVTAFANAINARVTAGRIALGPAAANGLSLFINGDDEQGVTLGGLLNANALPVPVTVVSTGTGILDAWIDFNQDGLFTPDEQVATNLPVLPGDNTFLVTTPATAGSGFTTSRFRLSKTGNINESGVAIGGEVEDHVVELVEGFAPDVFDDNYFVSEDGILVVAPGNGVLSNDIDLDDGTNFVVRDEDPLAAGLQPLEDVKRGELILNSDGSFTYTPEPDFFGVDTFVYSASDARLTSGTPATVTIEVGAINDAPTAFGDVFSIFEGVGPIAVVPNAGTHVRVCGRWPPADCK